MNDVEPSSLKAYLDEAETIAEDAAELLLQGYRHRPEFRKKSAVDLVSEYDLKSEALIKRRLSSAFPEHTFIGEESAASEMAEGLVWYADPVDGTTNFVHGHPFFCVSLVLCRGALPLVGVIVAPALSMRWSCARGLGATRNGARCNVSTTATLVESLCATGFPYDVATSDENNFREFVTLQRECQGIRRAGSAALDLAFVADGTHDGYWEQSIHPWDVGAGMLLVEEAGGRVTNYTGDRADVRTRQLVATNGQIHDAILNAIGTARNQPPL